MSPRQTEVLNAAKKVGSNPTAITRIVEPGNSGMVDGKPYPAAIARTRSIIDSLKKKGAWPYLDNSNGERPVVKTLLGDIPLGKPAAQQAPELPYCNLHQSEEDAVHDFGIKVLEEFSKLSRNSQAKAWSVISDLLDRTIKVPQ